MTAQAKFTHSDQDLRAIIDSAGDGICTIDRQGNYGYVNPRLAQMLHIDEAELLTCHFTEFLLPTDRELLVERFEQRMAGSDVPSEYELELLTRRGTTFWAAISVTSWKVNGTINGSLAIVRDITRHKQQQSSQADQLARLEERVAERTYAIRMTNQVLEEQIELARATTRQLENSEARWRSLVEHAPQFVVLLNDRGVVEFINRVVPGFELASVVGSSLLDLVPAHNRAFTQRMLHHVFIDRRRESYEIDGFGPHRSVAWYSINIGPILDKPGEPPTAAVLIAVDITERKATEAALDKRQKELAYIARLNNMGALTAELAHELNQPLAAISAYANGCLRALNDDRNDLNRVDTALRNICAQSARAGEIIRKIMDFLRKTDTPRQMTDINRLIVEVVQFLDLESRKHQVTFECDLGLELPEIPVNRVQIEQVLFNLSLNAIDAVRTSDAAARIVRIVSRRSGDEDVEISIIDQGCGFDADDAELIFQPFYTTKGQGLGMGLAISRMIVDEHGGKIGATSQRGAGTKFNVVLPGGIQSSGEMKAYVP